MEEEREKELYRECMHNHAALLGTYATDGCGEYTPDQTSPGTLQCAACGCHRNFHRKWVAADVDGDKLVGGYSPAPSEERADGKKRSRTKFSVEQKEKMLRFAGKIGWKLQRKDGDVDEITQFCREIGVSKQIFKVWLHNHKASSSSPTAAAAAAAASATGAGATEGNSSSLTQ